jgi:hypothetical protein
VVPEAAGQLIGERPLDAVLDVFAGDRGSVLELQPVLQGVGPGLAAVALRAGVRGEVGNDLRRLTGLDLPRRQATLEQSECRRRQVLALRRIEVDQRLNLFP